MKSYFIFVFFFYCLNGICQTSSVNPMEKVGDTITVSGRIYSANYLIHVKTKPTFLNLYDSSPSHRLMIRIDSTDREKFSTPPEKLYLNKNITIKGLVQNYKGTPLIKISDPEMIKVSKEDMDTILQANPVVSNKYVSWSGNLPASTSKTTTDTALQSRWVSDVAKQSQEMVMTDVRIVLKEMPLRVNPSNDAPIVATLQPGIAVSVLSTSNRWSYVAIKKPDGSGAVYGFIKKRMHKNLSKEQKQ